MPGIASFEVTLAGDEIRLDFELSGGERMPACPPRGCACAIDAASAPDRAA